MRLTLSVLRQTSFLYYENYALKHKDNMIHTIKQERLYQKKVNSSLVLLVTEKWAIQIKCLFVRFCMLNVVR